MKENKSQKTTYYMTSFICMPRIGRIRETENKIIAPQGKRLGEEVIGDRWVNSLKVQGFIFFILSVIKMF